MFAVAAVWPADASTANAAWPAVRVSTAIEAWLPCGARLVDLVRAVPTELETLVSRLLGRDATAPVEPIALWLSAAPERTDSLRLTSETVDDEEERLIRRASGGDERAMRALYERHLPLVKRKLSAILGPTAEVDDVIQMTFVRVFRNLDKFRGGARLSTWICRIALNQACNHLRSRRARSRFEAGDDAVVAQVADQASSLDQQVEQRRRMERLYHLLADVKPDVRVAFVLTEIEGHTLDEAAELLGISRNTVAARVRRTRERLVESLKKGRVGR